MERWEVPKGTNKSFFKTRIDFDKFETNQFKQQSLADKGKV